MALSERDLQSLASGTATAVRAFVDAQVAAAEARIRHDYSERLNALERRLDALEQARRVAAVDSRP